MPRLTPSLTMLWAFRYGIVIFEIGVIDKNNKPSSWIPGDQYPIISKTFLSCQIISFIPDISKTHHAGHMRGIDEPATGIIKADDVNVQLILAALITRRIN